jgi:hypothetical protein
MSLRQPAITNEILEKFNQYFSQKVATGTHLDQKKQKKIKFEFGLIGIAIRNRLK